MRILLVVLAGLALLGQWPAAAADLSVAKTAAKPRVLLSYAGSGTYFGLGTHGEAQRATIAGLNGPGVDAYAAGGAVALVGGYMWGDGTSWKAIEASAHWSNTSAGSTANPGVPSEISSRVGFTERFLLGGPIASMLSFLPNLSTAFPTLPVLPAGAVGTSHPYLFVAAHQDQIGAEYGLAASKVWRIRGGAGVGVKSQLGQAGNLTTGSPVTLDVWAEYLFPGQGITLGLPAGTVAAANTGGGMRIGGAIQY